MSFLGGWEAMPSQQNLLNDRKLAETAYSKAAKQAFATGSKLRSRVYEESGIVAQIHEFTVFGTTDAVDRPPAQDIVPANINNARPVARLAPWESFDYVDEMNQVLTSVAIARNKGRQSGLAVGRQFDAPIISALSEYDANAYSRAGLSSILNHDTSAGQFDSDDIAKAIEMLMGETDMDPSPEDCTLVYPSSAFSKMASDVKLASMDYITNRVTESGKFGQMYGCMPVFIGENARRADKGALPTSGGDKYAYLFVRDAIGLAVGTLERMGIQEWVPQKQAWMVGSKANGGATRLNNGGIVRITLK